MGQVKGAIVTGAARGIGAACVEAFANAGWAVVAVDRTRAELERIASDHPGQVRALVGDVVSYHTSAEAVAVCCEEFGQLDACVANAGVNMAKLVDSTSDREFDRLMNVNVRAVMYLAQAAHGALRVAGGSLTVVASKTGLVAQTHSPLYCASKGAAVMLAKALAVDWAEEGIRVNAVCPGIVDTPMLDEFIASLPEPQQARADVEVAQPLGRLATPRECAEAVRFVASPEASFISGVALPVDGGFTAQ